MAEGFVISDLHLGGGADDPREDFWLDDLFSDFVVSLARPDATLIINGDFIDFAQLEPLDVRGVPSKLLWNERASLTKLEAALVGHPACFAALGTMLAGGGKVRVVIGNHDLDFVWPLVQQRVRDVLGAAADDDRLSFVVGSLNYEGVHIEHGYQFSPENSPKDPNKFVHEGPDGVPYLERVWGTDFLLGFFNDLEREHKYVDNVKPTIKLAWHALRKRWIPVRALVQLAVAIKRAGIPWDTIPTLLDEGTPGPQTIPASFVDPEWQQLALELSQEVELVEEIQAAIEDLEPEDRKILIGGSPVEIGEPIELEGAVTLGAIRNTTREERAAKDRLRARHVSHVVFGHTHDIVDAGLDGAWFNPGSWIPHLDLRTPYVREKVKEYGWTLELVSDVSLYETHARAVRIRPTGGMRTDVELVKIFGP